MDTATLLRFFAGLALLIGGAELLVRGASRLARLLSVPPLVIGLTVVAFGTSSPELAVSLRSAAVDQVDLAIGNVVGSNIFNILFILGVSALLRPLSVDRKLVRLDVPVMIAVSMLPLILGIDGRIDRLEGTLLFVGVILYTVFLIIEARRERILAEPTSRPSPRLPQLPTALVLSFGGLWMIVRGADWLVQGAVSIARFLGVNELVIGLTLVAAGTSLPEVATSIVAALRDEKDLAIGNVVGSNIFNILAVLGGAAAVTSNGLSVSPSTLQFDLPIMLAVAITCLPIFFTGFRIDRWEGALFVLCYVLYLGFLVSRAEHNPGLQLAAGTAIGLVLTLSIVMSILSLLRRRDRGAR
jgi:cation:H+ antiporter